MSEQHRLQAWVASSAVVVVLALGGCNCNGGALGDRCEQNADCDPGLFCDLAAGTCAALPKSYSDSGGNGGTDASEQDSGPGETDATNIAPDADSGPACGNGFCSPNENVSTCPTDCCGEPNEPCGNGACILACGESCSSCPSDCGACGACGDGVCQVAAGEACFNCAYDCGACAPTCGDGMCAANAGENCANCAGDCGGCGLTCGPAFCSPLDDCIDCPTGCGMCPVCGDGTCQASDQEGCHICPVDCGVCPECTPDGACDTAAGENCWNCTDCQPCGICGDGECDDDFIGGTEDCATCPQDCCP